MKISIITVSYNSAFTIRDTIESVLNQTYPNIEYIIVDGLSSDNTVNIVKEFEPQFKGRLSWMSEKDLGIYDAMNKGIQIATGDIIGIINSDDFLCDQCAIEKIIQIFKENKLLDSVFADLYFISQQDKSNIVRYWSIGLQKMFKYGWHPALPTLFLKQEVYEKFGLFNISLKLAADFELMLRFFEKYHISSYYLQEPLVKMRIGGASNKNIISIISQNVECMRAFKLNGIKVNLILYPFFRILPKLLQFKSKH